MRVAKKLLLIGPGLGASLLLGACSSSLPDARPAFGYSGLEGAETALTSYDRGKVEFLAGRYGLAIQQFQQAMAEQPASVEAANGLAASYDQIGRFDLAKRYYRRALTADPNSLQTLNNLGYSLYLQGKYDLAVALFSDAIRKGPENGVVAANTQMAEAAWQRDVERNETLAAARQQEAPASQHLIAGDAAADAQAGPHIVRLKQGLQKLELGRLGRGEKRAAPEMMVLASFSGPAIAPPPPLPVEVEALPPVDQPAEADAPAAPAALAPRVRVAAVPAGRDVVVSSPEPAPSPAIDLTASLEVANGTGRRYMAARMGAYLERSGLPVARLSNADHFSHTATTITYRAGHAALAEALAPPCRSCPGSTRLPNRPPTSAWSWGAISLNSIMACYRRKGS